jgi:hypothetical protein
MNHSMHTSDRRTHLKIVFVGLLCAAVVTCIGIFAHNSAIDFVSGQLPEFR